MVGFMTYPKTVGVDLDAVVPVVSLGARFCELVSRAEAELEDVRTCPFEVGASSETADPFKAGKKEKIKFFSHKIDFEVCKQIFSKLSRLLTIRLLLLFFFPKIINPYIKIQSSENSSKSQMSQLFMYTILTLH